ncbi:MAG TPA: GTPase Era [Roseiflexaceae bacterium]|nr:GTPase Era [Roseiflexaceae bacterium]
MEAGSTDLEGECDGILLLDADGQIIGLELELDSSVSNTDLVFALEHPAITYGQGYRLLITLFAEEPDAQPLSEPVILDFDTAGRLQGCEISAAREFGLGERLARLAPFMIALEDETDLSDVVAARLAHEPTATIDSADAPGTATETIADDPAAADNLVAPPAEPAVASQVRSGFVALVGRPNVGKSTLLNAILGQKVAIVSPKPQTTRIPLRGILSRPDAQVIFVDTPGIHEPRTRLGNYMVDQARRAIPDADVVCMLVDITTPPQRLDERIAALVRRARAPRILVLNKVDLPNPRGAEFLAAYRELGPWDMEVALSALKRQGTELLIDEIITRLPLGPQLYPAEQLTDQSDREHIAELVREQVLRATEQEVPHSVAVEVEEWQEKAQAVYIRATIYVEKDSQKGILIGAGGRMLKRIGSAARRDAETHLGRPVYLDLWVKVRSNWRDDASALHWLGYRPDGS